jgi:transitional endoplasmic reticulum ATPase
MEAWEEMKALIVMPLCQANALDELLYGAGKEGRKTVCGGVLLVGKPGCGKSRLAYHCASVAASLVPSMTLLDVSCTSLVHKEVGGSERALRHLFSSARAAAPCILLMDGIENIAAVRGHDNTTEGTMDRILSTLLVELDGVDSQSDGAGKIAVIGITHNERWIDPALRRPGRLEKVIVLRNPDYDARLQIVQKEFRSLPRAGAPVIDTSDLASYVASHTDGMSGAEVLALCREARMESVRECIRQNKELDEFEGSIITREHFVAAGLTM